MSSVLIFGFFEYLSTLIILKTRVLMHCRGIESSVPGAPNIPVSPKALVHRDLKADALLTEIPGAPEILLYS